MRTTFQNVKKTGNGNLLAEVDSQSQAENIIKISRELALATAEEMTAALEK